MGIIPNLLSAMSALPASLSRFKIKGIQASLLLMCKSLLVLVLLQGTLVQGEPGLDFCLSQSGIHGFANETVRLVIKNIVEKELISPRHSWTQDNNLIKLWNTKISDMNLRAPTVSMAPGKGIHVAINDSSFRISSNWTFDLVDQPTKPKKGLVSVVVRGNMSMFINVPKDGLPLAKDCVASVERLKPSFERKAVSNKIDEYKLEQLKTDLELAICEKVLESSKHVIKEKLSFLKPLEYGHLTLNYHLNKSVTVGKDSIRGHLNGRFDGDSENLKMIDMDLPAEGDVGLAVSEEVIQSALRVWHNEALADLTFVRKAKDVARIFPYDWLKTDKLLRIRINAPIAPTVSISPKGLLTSASGSAELTLLTPGSDPSHPINVTFSGTTLFEVSMKYNKLRIAIEDFDFEASNSDDAKVDVEEFNGEILHIKEMYMDYIRKKSVVLIPVIQEDYIQSAWITVKDKFFRVFINLSRF